MLIDGPETGRSRIGGRSAYLKIAAVLVLAGSVLAVGFLGPHVSQKSDVPSPSVLSTGSPAAHVSSRPTTSGRAPTDLRGIETAMGLPLVAHPQDEVVRPLPLQMSGLPAIAGDRLFFVVAGTTLESIVTGSSADPVILASVPRCRAINQIAAAGNAVMYLITWPEPPYPTVSLCETFSRIHWSLQLLDLGTGKSREVASGTRPRIGFVADAFPIHFALTPDTYAFDRPDDESAAVGPETIEVHALRGALLWTTRSASHVVQLGLGDGQTLAVSTEESWPTDGTRTVWIAGPASRALQKMGETHSFLSVSPDGRYVVWDTTLRMGLQPEVVTADVAISDVRRGVIRSAFPDGGKTRIVASDPSVLGTSAGPFVAWLSLGPDQLVYPSFNWPGRGRSGFLESAQLPLWMAVSGNSLVWVAESADGWSATLYSVALDSL